MTSPVQVALRELMLLTKCYCDGQHPRLGHNCSFRPDVERLLKAFSDALAVCKTDAVADRAGWQVAYDVRRALLVEMDNAPATRSTEDAPHAAQIAQRLQDAALRQKEGTVDPAR